MPGLLGDGTPCDGLDTRGGATRVYDPVLPPPVVRASVLLRPLEAGPVGGTGAPLAPASGQSLVSATRSPGAPGRRWGRPGAGAPPSHRTHSQGSSHLNAGRAPLGASPPGGLPSSPRKGPTAARVPTPAPAAAPPAVAGGGLGCRAHVAKYAPVSSPGAAVGPTPAGGPAPGGSPRAASAPLGPASGGTRGSATGGGPSIAPKTPSARPTVSTLGTPRTGPGSSRDAMTPRMGAPRMGACASPCPSSTLAWTPVKELQFRFVPAPDRRRDALRSAIRVRTHCVLVIFCRSPPPHSQQHTHTLPTARQGKGVGGGEVGSRIPSSFGYQCTPDALTPPSHPTPTPAFHCLCRRRCCSCSSRPRPGNPSAVIPCSAPGPNSGCPTATLSAPSPAPTAPAPVLALPLPMPL